MGHSKPTCRRVISGHSIDFTSPVGNFGNSGYIQNNTLFDGSGWLPEKNMHSDMIRTEYRMRYNTKKPFQKMTTPTTTGKLPKRYATYCHNA